MPRPTRDRPARRSTRGTASGRRRVAVIVDTYSSYGRGLMRGILQYLRTHPRWNLYVEFGTAETSHGLHLWAGDGIIARVRGDGVIKALERHDVPKVFLSVAPPPVPGHTASATDAIRPDRAADTDLAARHFLERGFKRVAFCSLANGLEMGRRQQFVDAATRYGLDVIDDSPGRATPVGNWEAQQACLARWLVSLPKPIGICAVNDVRGQEVMEAARRSSIQVPEDLAVLGSDNDELICAVCDPPMSSIAIATEQIGYLAAERLDAMMNGAPAPPSPVLVPPIGIVTRQSTDVLAMEDRDIAAVVAYIRAHATDPINVSDLLRQFPIVRRNMERRFQRAIGRNPNAEIQRVQVERAKQLLRETDLSVAVVASQSGFSNATRLGETFRRAVGMTPLEYRRSVRPDLRGTPRRPSPA